MTTVFYEHLYFTYSQLVYNIVWYFIGTRRVVEDYNVFYVLTDIGTCHVSYSFIVELVETKWINIIFDPKW